MTVFELCCTNSRVTEVEIDIRGMHNELLAIYRVGSHAANNLFGNTNGDIAVINDKPLNAYEEGRDWCFIGANLPKQLHNLQVDNWMSMPGYKFGNQSSVKLLISCHYDGIFCRI